VSNPTGIDRRKCKRLDVALDVAVFIEVNDKKNTDLPNRLQATCSNLSLEGLCLETTHFANGAVKLLSGPAGARDYTLALEITLMPDEPPLQTQGEVCWYNVDHTTSNFTYQMGIEFIGLSSASRKTLKRFIRNNCRQSGLLTAIKSLFKSH